MGRQFEELANVHIAEGQLYEGVKCLLDHSRAFSTIERAKQLVIEYLWSNFGLCATPDAKAPKQALKLIEICSSVISRSDQFFRYDVRDISAICFRCFADL
jgi:hypothetical protein